MKIWTFLLAAVLALASVHVEAKRIGGGSSMGKQSRQVTQRASPSQAPGTPQQNVANRTPDTPATAAPARRPWGAMLGGLAAGLGLAYLASSLGLGEGFGQIMMVVLFAMLAMMAYKWFSRSRRMTPGAAGGASPFAFQGAGGQAAGGYKPENVGNDASARPWERNSSVFDALSPNGGGRSDSIIGSALGGAQTWGIPAGFDVKGFLTSAKGNFVLLQSAWDRADIATLRAMMTDGMLGEIQSQLAEREAQGAHVRNETEVVMLEAKLLGIEDQGEDYMASVEFSGMIREEPSSGPNPFREVWNMTKPKDGKSGWLVAGVQALQ